MIDATDLVNIWSDEHRAYWRPGAAGYTSRETEAGVWPREEAMRMTNHCGPEKKIALVPAAATTEIALAREKWEKMRSYDGDVHFLLTGQADGPFRIRFQPGTEEESDLDSIILGDRPSPDHNWVIERESRGNWWKLTFEVSLDDAVMHCECLADHARELQTLQREKVHSPNTETPWGLAQSAEIYGPGIISYSTERHGGFWLSAERKAKMPPALYRDQEWFEEDCEQALVVLSFPELFTSYEVYSAESMLKYAFPDSWERHYNRLVDADGAASQLFEMNISADEPLAVVSYVEDPDDPDMVRVVAAPNGIPEEAPRVFLVPAREFDVHDPDRFMVDPLRHQEVSPNPEAKRGPSLH